MTVQTYFPAAPPMMPPEFGMIRHWVHEHVWVECGATQYPSGVWHALYQCEVCTDVAVGNEVGPIPEGYCFQCGWVQRKPGKKKCEECKAPRETQQDDKDSQ